MKGVLVLTEPRSGSEWLGSLATNTGMLGNSGEWFAGHTYGQARRNFSRDEFIAAAMKRSSTPNGFFYIKLFPAHLHFFNIYYETDIITHLVESHDVTIILLNRSDKIRQAISHAKALQTEKWRSDGASLGNPDYDFERICRCYFLLRKAEAYWRSYLDVRQLDFKEFTYEDLKADPSPYVAFIADHAGIETLPELKSDTEIQSNALNERWHARFLEDVKTKDILTPSTPSRPAKVTRSNLVRFLRGKRMRPFPYDY